MEAKKFRFFKSFEPLHIVSSNLLGKTVLIVLPLAIITTLGTGQISRADLIH
jgi:hypothetical protein